MVEKRKREQMGCQESWGKRVLIPGLGGLADPLLSQVHDDESSRVVEGTLTAAKSGVRVSGAPSSVSSSVFHRETTPKGPVTLITRATSPREILRGLVGLSEGLPVAAQLSCRGAGAGQKGSRAAPED